MAIPAVSHQLRHVCYPFIGREYSRKSLQKRWFITKEALNSGNKNFEGLKVNENQHIQSLNNMNVDILKMCVIRNEFEINANL